MKKRAGQANGRGPRGGAGRGRAGRTPPEGPGARAEGAGRARAAAGRGRRGRGERYPSPGEGREEGERGRGRKERERKKVAAARTLSHPRWKSKYIAEARGAGGRGALGKLPSGGAGGRPKEASQERGPPKRKGDPSGAGVPTRPPPPQPPRRGIPSSREPRPGPEGRRRRPRGEPRGGGGLARPEANFGGERRAGSQPPAPERGGGGGGGRSSASGEAGGEGAGEEGAGTPSPSPSEPSPRQRAAARGNGCSWEMRSAGHKFPAAHPRPPPARGGLRLQQERAWEPGVPAPPGREYPRAARRRSRRTEVAARTERRSGAGTC